MDYSANHSPYSRWASETEIKSSLQKITLDNNNLPCGGIPLYADSGAVYIEQEDAHSLIIGSTGSKKTRLIGMPTLQIYANSGESFITTDPKAELYEQSCTLLKERGYKIFVLNLRNPLYSNGWNPLLIPYHFYQNGRQDKAIELVTDMANCITKEDCVNDSYWQNSASDLLAGLILTLFGCSQKKEIHFKSLRALRTQAFKCPVNEDKPFMREKFLNHINKESFIYSLLCGTVEVCDTTRGCIVSVFDQAMRPFFSQDNLIDILSGSDIDMKKIGQEKTAVFLIIPDENTLYNKLISVFVKQCYSELILEAQKHPLKKLPVRVNFMLDEFSTLPQISDFPAMITASRSRNIRFNLIIQSFNQLQKRYGNEAEIIKGNCGNLVFLHSRELSLLNEISDLSGNKNNEEKLITISMLQTLDKEKGETLVFHKRLHPYIASLLDIEKYPGISPVKKRIWYPKNTRKAENIFDFEEFCVMNSNSDIYRLFS